LSANHIQGILNGASLNNYFTQKNVALRGSYIVNSGQLYVGYFGETKE